MLQEKISKIQEEYRSAYPSTIFNKERGKLECAAHVMSHVDMKDLFRSTVFSPENGRVVFEYPFFKTFAHPENYASLVDFVIQVLHESIQKNGTFEIHVNLKSFTPTAARRYLEVIQLFCNKCLASNTEFSRLMTQMYLYNSPKIVHMISSILRGVVDDTVRSKIVIVPA